MGDPGSYQALLDHSQDTLVVVDDDGRITYANDAVRRILGYDPDAIVGTDPFATIHPDDRGRARRAFDRIVAADTRTERTVTYRTRTADETWVTLESRMSNDTADEIEGYVVSSRDVTDREATTARLEELAATTSDVLWMFNADWSELLFVNPAYEDVYGADVDTLRADPASFLDTIHDDDVDRVMNAMERLSAGHSIDIEYRVDAATADASWVWVQAEPVFEDGDVARITGFTRDVTDRRRRERQLYVLDTLLRHNLRNDLTVVLGEAEHIAADAPPVADRATIIQDTATALLESAEKGREIVDLLTTDHACREVDVARAATAAADTITPAYPHATIDATTPSEALAIGVDGLETALVELLENAVKHSHPDHPHVDLTVTQTTDHVTVTIDDDAPRLPAIEATVLTGHSEMHDVYHSSGLGLWLVHWLVELSNGDITVGSNDDGNRIELTFERSR